MIKLYSLALLLSFLPLTLVAQENVPATQPASLSSIKEESAAFEEFKKAVGRIPTPSKDTFIRALDAQVADVNNDGVIDEQDLLATSYRGNDKNLISKIAEAIESGVSADLQEVRTYNEAFLDLAVEFGLATEQGRSPFKNLDDVTALPEPAYAFSICDYTTEAYIFQTYPPLQWEATRFKCSRPTDPLADCLISAVGPACSSVPYSYVSESFRNEFEGFYNSADYRADINADQIVDSNDLAIFNAGVARTRNDIMRLWDSRSGATYAILYPINTVISEIRDYAGQNICTGIPTTAYTAKDLSKHFSPWFFSNLAGQTQGKGNVFIKGPVDFSNRFHSDRRTYSDTPALGQYKFRNTTPVCVPDLGVYDSETGAWLDDNAGTLIGQKYGVDRTTFEGSPISTFTNQNNDFRIHWRSGLAESDPTVRYQIFVDEHMKLGELHQYFFVTDIQRRILNPQFYAGLNLPPEILKNVTKRFFRGDGPASGRVRQNFWINANNNLVIDLRGDINLNQFFNSHFYFFGTGVTAPVNTVFSYYEALDALALTAYQLQGSPDIDTTSWGSDHYRYSAYEALNDAFSDWFSFRYGQLLNDPQAENVFRHTLWQMQAYKNTTLGCGTETVTAGHQKRRPACDPKFNIREYVGVTDESPEASAVVSLQALVPTVSTDNGIYPPGSSLAADDELGFLISAILHDLADDFGLGFSNVDKLIAKTVSLIERTNPMPIRYFGHRLQLAARQLWPDPANPGFSFFEDQIRLALMRRGIPVDARFLCSESSFQNAPNCCANASEDPVRCLPLGQADAFRLLNYPAPHRLSQASPYLTLGLSFNSGTGQYENNSTMERRSPAVTAQTVIRTGFGTLLGVNHNFGAINSGSNNPEGQCATDSPYYYFDSLLTLNNSCGFQRSQNRYTHPTSSTYTAYRFMQGSEFGPCDIFRISNRTTAAEPLLAGTPEIASPDSFFRSCSENPAPGEWCYELTGDRMSNMVLLAPGNNVRFIRDTRMCASESSDDGANYRTDVSAPGVRVVQAMPNGFSFRVTRLAISPSAHSYRLSVDDPSSTAADVYTWDIVRYRSSGNSIIRDTLPSVSGSLVNLYGYQSDRPVEINLTRTRSGQSESIKIIDAINKLDRRNGQQFVLRVGACANSSNCQ